MRWRDTAGVTIKLEVPAIQRHHREHAARARCLAISNVRFLYGPPSYKHTEANWDASVLFKVHTCKSGMLGINRPAKFLCSYSHLRLWYFMQQHGTLELLLFDPEEEG